MSLTEIEKAKLIHWKDPLVNKWTESGQIVSIK